MSYMISGTSCCHFRLWSEALNLFFSNRDESIKKLLEMLQSKGLSSRATEEDHERTRRLADAEMTIHQLEGLLEQKDKEMLQLREVCVCDWRRRNKVHSGIPMCAGVCLCVQPDVSACKSNRVISSQGPWLLPLLAHNWVLIQHRNINTYTHTHTHKYTGRCTPSYFFYSLLLVHLFSNISLSCYNSPFSNMFVVLYNSSLWWSDGRSTFQQHFDASFPDLSFIVPGGKSTFTICICPYLIRKIYRYMKQIRKKANTV